MTDAFDDMINDAFSNHESEAAPEMAWNRIDDELQNITTLDEQVKRSFEGITEKAPNFVWEKVQDQLDIDRVWQRISSKLIYRVRRSYIGHACSLLFLFVPFLLDHSTGTAIESERSLVVSSPIKLKENDANPVDFAQIIEATPVNQTQTLMSTQGVAQSAVGGRVELGEPIVAVSAENAKISTRNLDRKVNLLSIGSNLGSQQDIVSDIVQWNPPISKPRRGWIGGFTASLDHTWIIDQETRSGFKAESLVENKFSIGNSVGLFVEFPIKNNFAFHGEYLFHCLTRQANQSYVNGTYTLKEKEIRANRLVLLASYNSQVKFNRVSHSNVYRFGTFLSVVRENSIDHNGIPVELNSLRNRFDFGFQSEIGKRVYVRSLIVEAGLRGDFGLLNIANSTGEIPKHLNFTREASVGAYLKLGYRF